MASRPHSEPDTVEALRLARLIVEGDVDAWCDQDSDKLAAHALLRLFEQKEASDALLREAYTLIWLQDAPYVEGGNAKLDALAVVIGQHLGFPDSEIMAAPPSNPAMCPVCGYAAHKPGAAVFDSDEGIVSGSCPGGRT